MDLQSFFQTEFFLQVKGLTPGRIAALVPGVLGLISVVLAVVALLRKSMGSSARRLITIIALVLALVDILFSGLHLVRTTGGFGTGSGRLGAIVALLFGLTGLILGRRARNKFSRRQQ